MTPAAYLVVNDDGYRVPELDAAIAQRRAEQNAGRVVELVPKQAYDELLRILRAVQLEPSLAERLRGLFGQGATFVSVGAQS